MDTLSAAAISCGVTPKAFIDDYAEPAATQYLIRWSGPKAEWRILFPRGEPAHAGMILRRSYDYARHRPTARAWFRVTPASAAPHLGLALLDGKPSEAQTMVVQWARPGAGRGPGSAKVSFAFADFPAEGERLDRDGRPTGERRSFDWSAVQEIRLMCDGSAAMPEGRIIVEHLTLER